MEITYSRRLLSLDPLDILCLNFTSFPVVKLFSSIFRRTLRPGATGFSVAAAATVFKINTTPKELNTLGKRSMHSKIVIIGSGPAAHTAAVYLARAELKRAFPICPSCMSHVKGSSC